MTKHIEIYDETGATVNTIVCDEEFAEAQYPGAWRLAAVQPKPEAQAVPGQCTPAQGLVALYVLKNISEAEVLAAISSIQDPTARYTAQIAFSRATVWQQSSPAMQQIAQMLGLTDADLTEMFTLAVTIEV